MALSFFTQRDIDNFDLNNIPEEFVNYFNGLSDERKSGIISSRPELGPALGYSQKASFDNAAVEDDFIESNEDILESDFEDNNQGEVVIEKTDIESQEESDSVRLKDIANNIYEYIDFSMYLNKDLNPFEALIISNGQKKCRIHRKSFSNLQFKYKAERGGVYGVAPLYCDECKRLFLEQDRSSTVEKALTERNIQVKLYSLELTKAFINSCLPVIEITSESEIYFPDSWVEDNPMCQIHHEPLDESDCIIGAEENCIKLKVYYCSTCDKYLLRRSAALDLEEECSSKGIPMPIIKPLVAKSVNAKQIFNRDIIPDFFIQEGEQFNYKYGKNDEIVNLSENDTIVVSDSIYCSLSGHDCVETMANFVVELKKKSHVKKNYVCSVGYCSQCNKYYLAEEDYKVVYSLGRPEVNVISDIEDAGYQITSGEVFELEKQHLDDLENEFDEITDSIHDAKDYANQYATYKGGYDEGGLSVAKERSKRKYGKKLGDIDKYRAKPYSYRVDITFAGKTEVYYIGADDIEFEDGKRVYSFNSDFGRQLVNIRNINIIKDGKQYDIALTRQFDIEAAQLYGYANLRTKDDLIFREGITDPFLVKVLKLRKQQHSLVDIIATVQENQNAIVDETLYSNLIVQGCAGSGKTMVLLHRLSALKYNHPEFAFEDAVILTPNEQFNLHIQGLAEGLQLGNIRRLSIEEYYQEVLLDYDEAFVPSSRVANEINVNQQFVDYIYSDEFITKMNEAFVEGLDERGTLGEMLDSVCSFFNENTIDFDKYSPSELMPAIKQKNVHFEAIVAAQDQEYKVVKDKYDNLLSELEKINKELPKAKKRANNIVKEVIPSVYFKLSEYDSNHEKGIYGIQSELKRLQEEVKKTESQFLPFGRKAKLEELDREIDKIKRHRANIIKKFKLANEELAEDLSELSDEEIISWIQKVTLYVPEVMDEVRQCVNIKNAYKNLQKQKEDTLALTLEENTTMLQMEKNLYPDEIKKAIVYISSKIDEYSDYNFYFKVFEAATSGFLKEHKLKSLKGIHRYDLYARILFCIKYYGKVNGTLKLVCVDEGQDLALNEYKIISSINQNKLLFNIFGDTNQLLKPGRGISDWSSLKNQFDMKEFVLNENYRNTNQITRFCNDSFDMKVMQTGVDGPSIKEIRRVELEQELSNTPIVTERVAILLPRSVRKTSYIKKDLLPTKISRLISNKIDNGLISLMYVDEVKGIEFDRVYVISNKMTKNEKYIAFTRALTELIVVVDNNITAK
ncbi:hypothetical protein SAMN02910384_00015 [Pseudobutyrivibrio sp. ACV-2]|uniref:hypothetical protein n=1 Tax=Pseudobutyrivibrio sp. ACV-2 TaxID=1520801 RepID=UPI0008984C55|nr:hypothetical protein [Pseudobutyrivibrio sp. ACV-2]SDZ76616.1 hypothetical protein SAMN02910384_00015 [Pseudobutyrivibrio sp. ACV-2]